MSDMLCKRVMVGNGRRWAPLLEFKQVLIGQINEDICL